MDDYGQPPGRRRGRTRSVPLLVIAAVLVVAGVVTCAVVPATRAAAALSAARVAGLPVALPGIVPFDLSRPFAGTPAEHWADGGAGLTVPDTTAIGDFSAEEVATAVDQVRQLVTLLNLDRAVIEERRFDRFLGLLSENQRATSEAEITGRTELFPGYLTVLAEGFPLLPAGLKAEGGLSFGPGSSPGELYIDSDVMAVYAFDPRDAVVLVQDDFLTVRRIMTSFVVRKSPPCQGRQRGHLDQRWRRGHRAGRLPVPPQDPGGPGLRRPRRARRDLPH